MFVLTFKKELLFIFMLFVVTACGGGSGGSSSSPSSVSKTLTGTLIDSEVSGVNYYCEGYSGITSIDGEFNYSEDCGVITFSIGGVLLSKLDAKDVPLDSRLYITDLVGVHREATTDAKVLKILRVLQSFNENANANDGVRISADTREELKSVTLDLEEATEEELVELLSNSEKELVSAVVAVEHFEETLRTRENITFDTIAKAEIQGNLAEATVQIIELNVNSSNILLATETTNSDGTFDAHLNELNANKLYLFQVKGGVDQLHDQENNGTIRTIVSGSFAKSNDFTVSVASELLYTATVRELKYSTTNAFINTLLAGVQTILPNALTLRELLQFTYSRDAQKLNRERFPNINERVVALYSNKPNQFASGFSSAIATYKAGDRQVEALVLSADKNIAYVGTTKSIEQDTIKVLDISNKFNPRVIDEFLYNSTFGNVQAMVLSEDGTKLYILDSKLGLSYNLDIYDIDSEHKLSRLGTIEIPSFFIKSICTSSNPTLSDNGIPSSCAETKVVSESNFYDEMILYKDKNNKSVIFLSASKTHTLQAVYVEDPTNPILLYQPFTIIGDWDNGGNPVPISIGVDDIYVTINDGRPSIKLANIQNFDKTGKAQNTDLPKDILYVADGNVTLYDHKNFTTNQNYEGSCELSCRKVSKGCSISTSSSCKLITNYNYPILDKLTTSGDAQGVVAEEDKNLIYVADGKKGFKILHTKLFAPYTNYVLPSVNSGGSSGVSGTFTNDGATIGIISRAPTGLDTNAGGGIIKTFTTDVISLSGGSTGTLASTGNTEPLGGETVVAGTLINRIDHNLTLAEITALEQLTLEIKVTINGTISKTLIDTLKYNDVDACADNGDIMTDLSCLEVRVGN